MATSKGSKILRQFDLSSRNTLKIAAIADAYIRISRLSDVAVAIDFAKTHSMDIFPIGDGSNVLLGDLSSTLVLDVAIKGIRVLEESSNDVLVEVAAGENWHNWVVASIKRGWYGLENLALIPGRVGAAPIQNIGAYGREVGTYIERVRYFDLASCDNGNSVTEQEISAEDCLFSYRDSIFKSQLAANILITAVIFRLSKNFSAELSYPSLKSVFLNNKPLSITAKAIVEAVIKIRREKLPDPDVLPNVGSFFKNVEVDQTTFDSFFSANPRAPYYLTEHAGSNKKRYKIPAGWLIEACGFKAKKYGSLGMHEKQALVLVNYFNSVTALSRPTAQDVINFSQIVQQAVQEKFGFSLEVEPVCYKTT